MSNITLTGHIIVPETDLDAVLTALPIHTRLTLEEDGCLEFSVTRSVYSPVRFDVYEVFVDQEAFDLHQKRAKASDWGAITVNVERHYTIINAT